MRIIEAVYKSIKYIVIIYNILMKKYYLLNVLGENYEFI